MKQVKNYWYWLLEKYKLQMFEKSHLNAALVQSARENMPDNLLKNVEK